MEYTDIDPKTAVDSLMAEKYAEHQWQAFTQKLDCDALLWCCDIAKLTDSGDKGVLAEALADSANEKQEAAISTSEKFIGKILDEKLIATVNKAIETRKLEWLPTYIASVETEYAQHEALAELAELEDDSVTAGIHRTVMLRNEAAQQVALKALKG